MLTALSIRDLVLIERVDLDLLTGLTVLTGETGAGKSILLDALGLALGDRADATLVRKGAAQAGATARFQVPPGHEALALLATNDIPFPEGDTDILVRRVVKADGGSRAFINDEPVSAALLRQVGALLVEIHGQHDERGLLNPRSHLELVDQFSGHDDLVAATATAYQGWRDAASAHAAARDAAEKSVGEREWLRHAVDELTALNPAPGEEAQLADLRQTMQNGAKLAESLDTLDTLISSGDGALAQLRQAARRLERLVDTDPSLTVALAAVDQALVEGDAIEAALALARARFDISPEALETAESRLFELRAMARKHRVTPEELPELAATMAKRLEAIDHGGDTIATLAASEAAALAAFGQVAARLTASRRAAAARLDTAVNAELPALKLEAARFRTMIGTAPAGPTGHDQLHFEVATNAGSGFGPLTRIASGGEMSRFVLALKVALASAGTAGTLIFDEIDRGVGGATASAIGARLARVAQGAQVLVVTHSPQVAASGAHHARISKDGGATGVTLLDGEARLLEIARMLSGAEITVEARAQAARLLG